MIVMQPDQENATVLEDPKNKIPPPEIPRMASGAMDLDYDPVLFAGHSASGSIDIQSVSPSRILGENFTFQKTKFIILYHFYLKVCTRILNLLPLNKLNLLPLLWK